MAESVQRILEKMTPVFREALDAPDLLLTEKLNATQVPNWDSLNHITLIVELETLFGMEFSTEELADLLNVGDMARLILQKSGQI